MKGIRSSSSIVLAKEERMRNKIDNWSEKKKLKELIGFVGRGDEFRLVE